MTTKILMLKLIAIVSLLAPSPAAASETIGSATLCTYPNRVSTQCPLQPAVTDKFQMFLPSAPKIGKVIGMCVNGAGVLTYAFKDGFCPDGEIKLPNRENLCGTKDTGDCPKFIDGANLPPLSDRDVMEIHHAFYCGTKATNDCPVDLGPLTGHMRKFWRLTKFDHDLDAAAQNRPYTVRGPLFDDRSDCAQAVADVSKQNDTGDGLFCAAEWKWVRP